MSYASLRTDYQSSELCVTAHRLSIPDVEFNLHPRKEQEGQYVDTRTACHLGEWDVVTLYPIKVR